MKQHLSEKEDRYKLTKERASIHDDIHRILSAKVVHTPSFVIRLIVIIFGLIVTYSFLQEVLEIRDSLRLYRTYNSYEKALTKLKLNNPAPLKAIESEALPSRLASICQIGKGNTKPIKIFNTPKNHPIPAVGSIDLFDLDKCTTYADRYRPYENEALEMNYLQGYPSSLELASRPFWEEADEMKAELIDINIKAEAKGGYHDWEKVIEQCRGQSAMAKQALVLRAYENYTWGLDDIRNVRAFIVELALNPEPKNRYDVHLLVEVHTRNSSYVMSEKERLAILQRSIPREFWSLTTLWSEEEMSWLYPDLPDKFLNHIIPTSSYRSCFMPVQVFSKNHPQYDFIWNWEMDTRSTQEYGEAFDKIAQYANQAPIDQLLEKQTRWHIPASSKFGDHIEANEGEADLITLNPFFNANNSGYYWAYDYQNFPKSTLQKASIGKNVRFSKRLLKAMSDANSEEKISAHCENYAATILVRNAQSKANENWKGVYVPHPIYTRHIWPEETLSKAVNREDIYRKVNERVLREFSFYYDGAHAKDIYDAWRNNSNVCRAPSLLHPIKRQL